MWWSPAPLFEIGFQAQWMHQLDIHILRPIVSTGSHEPRLPVSWISAFEGPTGLWLPGCSDFWELTIWIGPFHPQANNDLYASTVRGDQDVKRETNMYPKGSQYRLLGYTALCQFAHSTSNWIQAKSKCSNVRKADTASAKAPCECTKEHQPVGVVIVPAKATSPWALAWNHCKIRHQPCL